MLRAQLAAPPVLRPLAFLRCARQPTGVPPPRRAQVRFSKHVLPGDTLQVLMWAQPGEGSVIFETRVKGRGGAAISNAAVVFRPGRMRAGAVAKL